MLKTLALAALVGWSCLAAAAPVAVVEMRGAISPASSEHLSRAIASAWEKGVVLLILKLDTPGGLDSAMREMIQDILASPVPVATYVAPSGARAASAGTYILYASHVAAMAPGTNLGAATPVAIGPDGGEPKRSPRDRDAGKEKGARDSPPPSSAESMRAKMIQDAAAYLRSLAQMRGRNVEWAERAVTRAESLSAVEALQLKVIDLMAEDVAALLHKADGRTVKTAQGAKRLALTNAQVYTVERDWKNHLLAAIADPNIAIILMMLGIYGLVFEFYNPGVAFPGVVGISCLLLAAYGLHLLPLNYVGVMLMLAGLAFMIAEAFFPSFGALGIGGVAAFIAGALMLVDTDVPGLSVSWQMVIPLAVVSAVLLFAVGALALQARRRPVSSGAELMVGKTAQALEDFEASGWVLAAGERWRAVSRTPMKKGDRARILRVDSLTLEVESLKGGQ